MAVQMSEKQFRQQYSPEQRKGLERLMQRQAEENRRATESEASTDTPKSILSGSSGPPSVPPRTPPAPPANPPSGESHGGGHPPKVVPVRVVENHPSVAAQPVKIVSDSTTAAVVSSVHHLEEETKFGFYRLVMAFSQLYDSLKNLGSGQRGPSAAPAQGSPARQHQRTYDPARPDSGPIKPYTRQADKFETYGGKVFHEKVRDAFTPEALGDRLKNAMFDRDGIIGGYAHRMFDRKRIGKRYAGRVLRESNAERDSIEEAAKVLAAKGASEKDVAEYRATRLESAKTQGIITDRSEQQLIKDGIKINDLRQQASKKVGILEDRKDRGERKNSINRSTEATELKQINDEIGKLDPREAYLLQKYEDNQKKKHGEPTLTPTPAPVEPEIGSKQNPYVWQPSQIEPVSATTGNPIETQRPGNTSQSEKESQEETSDTIADFLKHVEKIEENTRPIPDIYKFLSEKPEATSDGEVGAVEPSSILPSIEGLIPSIPGATTALGLAKKLTGPVGARVLGSAYTAYGAYSDYSDADAELAAGDITEDEATVKKGGAVGEGVLGVGGSIAGYGVGAGLGAAAATGLTALTGGFAAPLAPIITQAGGALGTYYGGKIAGAIGEVAGETATAGAQSLYDGYQWLTGQEDPEAIPQESAKKRKRGGYSRVVGDTRETPRDEFWTDGKYSADFMGPLPGEQLKSMTFGKDGVTTANNWGPIDRMDAGSIKQPPASPPPAATNNTGIVVNAPNNSTTQVMPSPPKPSFNTDPTFLKYGSSRWS